MVFFMLFVFEQTSYSFLLWLVTIVLFAPVGTCSNSRSQMFCKIDALKNPAIFTGKHLCWSFFLVNFIKNVLQHQCFPVNIAKFLSTAFLQNFSFSLHFSEILCYERILQKSLGAKLLFVIFLVSLLYFPSQLQGQSRKSIVFRIYLVFIPRFLVNVTFPRITTTAPSLFRLSHSGSETTTPGQWLLLVIY